MIAATGGCGVHTDPTCRTSRSAPRRPPHPRGLFSSAAGTNAADRGLLAIIELPFMADLSGYAALVRRSSPVTTSPTNRLPGFGVDPHGRDAGARAKSRR